MRDRLRPALGLVASLIAMLVAACGGGGATNASIRANAPASAPDALPTKAHFVAQAQAICSALSAQEKPLKARQESLKGLPATSADTAFVALVHQLVTLSRVADAKLEALPRPAGDAHAIEKLLTGFSEETTEASAIAKAADNQESTLGEASEDALKRLIADNSVAANEYGMSDCIGSE